MRAIFEREACSSVEMLRLIGHISLMSDWCVYEIGKIATSSPYACNYSGGGVAGWFTCTCERSEKC